MMKKIVAIYGVLLFLLSCQASLSEEEKKHYTDRGNEIAKSAGDNLSSTLSAKMKEGGISEAIGFCSQSALPITREISASHGAQIKRTSLKVRNPENQPTENEIIVLREYEEKKKQGQTLTPVVRLDKAGNPKYHAPILVQKKCLMCHGRLGKELSAAVDSLIKSKYPEDLATGYGEGDLRGMWSITFDLPEE